MICIAWVTGSIKGTGISCHSSDAFGFISVNGKPSSISFVKNFAYLIGTVGECIYYPKIYGSNLVINKGSAL